MFFDEWLNQIFEVILILVAAYIIIRIVEICYSCMPKQFRDRWLLLFLKLLRTFMRPESARSYLKAVGISSCGMSSFFVTIIVIRNLVFESHYSVDVLQLVMMWLIMTITSAYIIFPFSNPWYGAMEFFVEWPLKYLPSLKTKEVLRGYYGLIGLLGIASLVTVFIPKHYVPLAVTPLVFLSGLFVIMNVPEIFGVISKNTSYQERKKLVVPQTWFLPIASALLSTTIAIAERDLLSSYVGMSSTRFIIVALIIPFIGFLIPYSLLIHLPFYIGQKRWKSHEISQIESKAGKIPNSAELVLLELKKHEIQETKNYPYEFVIVILSLIFTAIMTYLWDLLLKQTFRI